MNSKITPEARARCEAHTLQDQLAKVKAIHAVETALLEKRQAHDMQEVELALEADRFWGGNYARLTLPLDGAD